MNLVALILSLLIEQLRPLPVRQLVIEPLRWFAAQLAERFNGGREGQGQVAWVLAVLPATALTWGLGYFLAEWSGVLGFVFTLVVVYLTLGFRQESHFFSDLHLALRMGELDRARLLLSEWQDGPYDDKRREPEVVGLAIEQALYATHRNVFGVMCWFVVLGPAGAVLYRLARFFDDEWGKRGDDGFDRFGQCARQAFRLIDWIPLRLTALIFAVAGNFEDAIFCWRTQAVRWADRGLGVLIASGAGALGVRLGEVGMTPETGEAVRPEAQEQDGAAATTPPHTPRDSERPEVGVGAEACVDDMQGTVGLVWRALVVYLLVLTLTVIAARVGS
ncbi:cobalamin biosynthesis protein CobD [Betaproteobacteria bacterium]|nr:cobalamin biosynthesis protein CobD [Betaproteobacteria bacterium]GHT92966.1 cobalamin biosynthesis protein CobD [Betaproteobacteria bacterium]GHU01583.1 cobalamin biosynthesis protein CobD [Betaproteobacteria bacterium]GHU04016.1 cobalamin biosynthesis protein CobD [Betaproteobacteria bacterium]GHU10238.1 cobalamin biosynthesis protein CobD [Betaproteobacteria bacterium]